MRNQVRELLTNYGKIDIMWFDFSYDVNIEEHIYFMPNKETGYCDIIASRYERPVIMKYHKECYETNKACYY